jgi:hypothetical protein
MARRPTGFLLSFPIHDQIIIRDRESGNYNEKHGNDAEVTTKAAAQLIDLRLCNYTRLQ